MFSCANVVRQNVPSMYSCMKMYLKSDRADSCANVVRQKQKEEMKHAFFSMLCMCVCCMYVYAGNQEKLKRSNKHIHTYMFMA
jgi:hypothetical protein